MRVKPIETTAETLTHANGGKPKDKSGKPVTITGRRIIAEANAHAGAGKDKSKDTRIQALTLVELLYNAKLIDMNMLMAADRFRTLHLEREGPSQGVGSYGDNPGGTNPATKGDRVGHAMTGVHINWRKGTAKQTDRPGLRNSYDYQAALLAMCGVIDVEGKRVHDDELVRIMLAAVVQTTDIPTQGAIAKLRTRYGGEKQLPPAGATVVTEALRRLTLHLKFGG
jgi:hypothetical protein